MVPGRAWHHIGTMRLRSFLKIIAVLAVLGAVALYFLTLPSELPAGAFAARTPDSRNGEVVFYAGGCSSCHGTPNQDDKTKLGGGLALQSPFGTFHAPNISPDAEHGIGRWTEVQFANALLRGVGAAGEHLYPAFPYTSYHLMNVDDARDLFAFIRTLPPDATPSLPHELPFPFGVRRGIGLWKLLFLDRSTFAPDRSKDAQYNRGGYLVQALSHCAECHSTRNMFGAIEPERRFAGGPNPTGKGWIPNITPHPDGIADWSEKDIAYLLETGMTPENDSVGSSMAEVVATTSRLPAEDREAIARFIKALPPRPGRAPPGKQE